jgi:membrane-associated phospholipid phosphatase
MYFLVVAVLARVRRLVATAWALGQAALLGYLIASMYKAFTGRLPPPSFRHYTAAAPAIPMVDSSHGFQLGFWRGGIFWGWPSSHTTVAFSMSLCLLTLYPKKKVVALLALVYAFYIGLSVSVTIHWLSEFVAGAIIGSVIGVAVGRSFRDKLAPLAP